MWTDFFRPKPPPVSLAYLISQNCVSKVVEIPGKAEHPAIRWAFDICGLPGAADDTEAWCAAWQALTAMLAGQPLPAKPARARSWLTVGEPVPLGRAVKGDTVVLSRGEGRQPGPEVLDAPGHVGRLVSVHDQVLMVVGGNQGNRVSVSPFPVSRLLGLRRIA